MRSYRFYAFLFFIALAEVVVLALVRIEPSPAETKTNEPIRITLVPKQPKNVAPKPLEKPKVVRKKVSHVTPRVKPTTVLPKATEETQNLLVAQAGTITRMEWGEAAPAASGDPKGYTPPSLLTQVDTDSLYTPKMKAEEEEGDVVIDVWVDPQGLISRSKVVVSSVYDDINRIATGLLRTLRFEPAHYHGKAVEGEFQLNFRFRLTHT
jgi:TonB family protein